MSNKKPDFEGGTLRPDGTVRPVVKVKPGWVGDLERQAYKPRGKTTQESMKDRNGPREVIGGKLKETPQQPTPKTTKSPKTAPTPTPPKAPLSEEEELNKKIKAVEKKMKEIAVLEEKEELDELQKVKLAKKDQFQAQLDELTAKLASLTTNN
eukprot:TRINITY_DN2383_c0_g1_i1.p2 TRINITY_DN2383_c0_g1~~TRINITY_DN2383_c0_g1_i1.p2  ORF type:complete len:153 (+),score=49.84 TRINITY_DN2383_c0_g1_i1:11-469(+)